MCRDCSWRDQEDGCCWNPISLQYLTEVDEDEEVCEEYEPNEETENAQ